MPDEFQSQYMAEGASVRHTDKRVSRRLAALLGLWAPFCWALAIFIGFANATSDKPLPASALPFVIGAIAALGFLFAGMAVTFAVLRTIVTETDVNVKYGLWGPRIPLDRITACKVVDYEWTKFGGYGLRRGLEGKWAYVPGPGEVVEIVYGDGQIVQIGAEDARKLSLEINRARQALQSRRTAAPGAVAKAADDAAAEAEAEAVAEMIATENSAAAKHRAG